jgi:transposase-like protein
LDELSLEAKAHLKGLIEGSMEADLQLVVGAGRYERGGGRRGHRNGSYTRDLVTTLGVIEDLRVPRLREGSVGYRAIERYRRFCGAVDSVVLECFVSGVSTRRMRHVLKKVYGRGVSAQSVSNRLKALESDMARFHKRSFAPDDYAVILLDGLWLNVREVFSERKVMLFAYGIRHDGRREILDFRLAKGESEKAWEALLNSLYRRGLEGKGTDIIVHDGAKGLEAALAYVYPDIPTQRCVVHKLRDLIYNIKNRSHRKEVAKEASYIYRADTKAGAVARFRKFHDRWKDREARAVRLFHDGFDKTLTYFSLPKHMWAATKTTNYIERAFKEIRKRIKPIGAFANKPSCERVAYMITELVNQSLENSPAFYFTQLN